MSLSISLQDFWRTTKQSSLKSTLSNTAIFSPETRLDLPPLAQHYFAHAIQSDVPLASAVHLKMQGEIKLKNWYPFHAEQVICWQRGMIWQATVKMKGLLIYGFDSWLEGTGKMQWRLLGLLPVMQGEGEDISRSALGRMLGECVWLPSVLYQYATDWKATQNQLEATLVLADHTTRLVLQIGDHGQLENLKFKRWGNPEGRDFHYADFGGFIHSKKTFSGYTIPTNLQVGWYFGTDAFAAKGEFFRAEIESANFC